MNDNDLSFLTKYNFNTLKDAYEYILNVFEQKKVEIKEIKFRKTITLILRINISNTEKDIEVILLYNKENLLNDDMFKNEIKYLKNEINLLKTEIDDIKLNIKSNKLKEELNNIQKEPLVEDVVEYGETIKNDISEIKKGKDFIHNSPSIVQDTTGKKNIVPLTIRALFGGKTEDKIKLNIINKLYPIVSLTDVNYNVDISEIKKGKDFIHNSPSIVQDTTGKKNMIPLTLKSLFGGKTEDKIKLDPVKGKVELFPNVSFTGINYKVEYGTTIGYIRPIIKKGKDFIHRKETITQHLNNNIITPTIKSLFGGKVDENIKLNKINEKLELFAFERNRSKNQKRSKINYDIKYGETKGFKRPIITKGKDFIHFTQITK